MNILKLTEKQRKFLHFKITEESQKFKKNQQPTWLLQLDIIFDDTNKEVIVIGQD